MFGGRAVGTQGGYDTEKDQHERKHGGMNSMVWLEDAVVGEGVRREL